VDGKHIVVLRVDGSAYLYILGMVEISGVLWVGGSPGESWGWGVFIFSMFVLSVDGSGSWVWCRCPGCWGLVAVLESPGVGGIEI
jgi:hypothetical protein